MPGSQSQGPATVPPAAPNTGSVAPADPWLRSSAPVPGQSRKLFKPCERDARSHEIPCRDCVSGPTQPATSVSVPVAIGHERAAVESLKGGIPRGLSVSGGRRHQGMPRIRRGAGRPPRRGGTLTRAFSRRPTAATGAGTFLAAGGHLAEHVSDIGLGEATDTGGFGHTPWRTVLH